MTATEKNGYELLIHYQGQVHTGDKVDPVVNVDFQLCRRFVAVDIVAKS